MYTGMLLCLPTCSVGLKKHIRCIEKRYFIYSWYGYMNMKVRAWNGIGHTQGVAWCTGDVSQKNLKSLEPKVTSNVNVNVNVCVFGKLFLFTNFMHSTTVRKRHDSNEQTEKKQQKFIYQTTFLSIFRPHVIGFDGNGCLDIHAC